MKILRILRNYLCYCGIEKEEFNAIKKDAYVSNFQVWRLLHILLTLVFAFLFVYSLFDPLLGQNLVFYLVALIYSAIATFLFFVLDKKSIVAQLLIYLSISMLFLFGCLITQNKPTTPSTTFIVLLLITPMFMIDKPFFMAIELVCASTVFLVWMYNVKPHNVWQNDFINVIIYSVVGIFIHIIANSIRIREFVLTRKINIQKDIDELTEIKNKAALTREINEFLLDKTKDNGIFMVLDIDHFKSINDTYGHDVGDIVIKQVGKYLKNTFINDEIVGRFGGDEFIIFIKNNDNLDYACDTADSVVNGITNFVELPNKDEKLGVSIGISIYHGEEKNYSEIFKKADVALYKTKADRTVKFNVYS